MLCRVASEKKEKNVRMYQTTVYLVLFVRTGGGEKGKKKKGKDLQPPGIVRTSSAVEAFLLKRNKSSPPREKRGEGRKRGGKKRENCSPSAGRVCDRNGNPITRVICFMYAKEGEEGRKRGKGSRQATPVVNTEHNTCLRKAFEGEA